MAQPALCIRSVFGLQCFFLFLLTSWEAGAATLQEPRKTGESSTSDHLFSLTPAPVSITPSNHTALHSEHSSPDPLKSTETHKPKHRCTTTRRCKLAHRAVSNSQSATTQVAPPASEQNSSKQGIENKYASESNATAKTDKGSDSERLTTTVSNKKNITCLKSTTSRSTVTSKPAKVVTSSTTSNKTTEKATQKPGKGFDGKQSTIGGHERTTGTPEKSTEHEGKTTGDNERATGASEKSTQHKGKTTSNHERTTETFGGPTGHGEKITSGHENTAATENIRPPVKVTGDASVSTTSPCTSNTEASRRVPTGSVTPTRSIVSEVPNNKSHPQQNKDDLQGGVHEGETEGSDSFPAWAIVVVILLSVILLLVFIGLIVLACYLARTRRALIQNTENNDSENVGGSNSYPVYLMEQQTLGPSQTPGPR
ncbi:mucin-like protein 3 [Cervus canadensis]|uniref:mucin-like protein 3 n=1 Tax=Cervus canadensis TaxID=1574408 RepID=UPI001CA375ED|nr:mucin-like protein 3 [Cervus canadensis]